MEIILSEDSIDRHHAYMLARGHGKNTAMAYRSDLMNLVRLFGPLPLPILPNMAAGYLTATRGKVSAKTTMRRLSSLRSWAKFAGVKDFLTDYQTPKPAHPRPHPLPNGQADLETLEHESRDDCQMLALLALCGRLGLRISEARSITADSFDGDGILMVQGKGDRFRELPVPDDVMRRLQGALRLAADRPGSTLIPWSDRWARQKLTALGKKAGLSRPIASHDLRSTFGMEVYGRSKDLRATQELLGHSDPRTTVVYTNISMEAKRAAMGMAEESDNTIVPLSEGI